MKTMLRSFVSGWLLLPGLALLPVALPAQIILSFTGTANEAANGFTLGQSATFTFTINEGYVQGDSDGFGLWYQDENSSAPLYSAIGGAISGTLAPTAPGYYTYLLLNNSDSLEVYMLDATGMVLNNEASVTSFQAQINGVPGLNFVFGSYESPTTYLANYIGDYVSTNPGDYIALGGTGSSFTITNFSIAASAIPEPSTYAAMFGVCVLGLAVWRKRSAVAPLAA